MLTITVKSDFLFLDKYKITKQTGNMRKPSSFVKLASEANKTPKTKSFGRLLRKYRIEKAILNMNKEHINTFMEPFEGC